MRPVMLPQHLDLPRPIPPFDTHGSKIVRHPSPRKLHLCKIRAGRQMETERKPQKPLGDIAGKYVGSVVLLSTTDA